MPTFTAIAFDRLIDPGSAKSMEPVRTDPKLGRSRSYASSRLDRSLNAPATKLERGVSVPPSPKLERGVSLPRNGKPEKGVIVPLPPNMTDRRNGGATTTASVVDKKHHWTQISPALYATPESTPLPDSPSSFPPSPYIINHKRRGPRLMKSSSEDDVATSERGIDEIKVDENGIHAEEAASLSKDDSFVPKEVQVSTMDDKIKPSDPGDTEENYLNGVRSDEDEVCETKNGATGKNGLPKVVALNLLQDSEVDDFVDPQESLSVKSNEGNGGADRSSNSTAHVAEFFDAWEELSQESGTHHPVHDTESELREIRLSLLMEIEKRKQAEETLSNLRHQWKRTREQLSLVGLTLPEDPTTLPEGEHPADDPAAEVSRQVYLARFVSNSIGRGIARAEVAMEMEAQLNVKNFEIARLLDRLRYYEAVNQEMSQRNQEVVETARRLRQRRKRRQKWIFGSIATAVTLGSAVLAYSYFHGGKGSSYPSPSRAPEVNRKPN